MAATKLGFCSPSWNLTTSSKRRPAATVIVSSGRSNDRNYKVGTVNGKKVNGVKEIVNAVVDSSLPLHASLHGNFVEDRFVYRQVFVIRSYEIGPDKTATMETLMNLLQVCSLLFIILFLISIINYLFLYKHTGDSFKSCNEFRSGWKWIRSNT